MTMIIAILILILIILCHLLPRKIRKKVLGNLHRYAHILKTRLKKIFS